MATDNVGLLLILGKVEWQEKDHSFPQPESIPCFECIKWLPREADSTHWSHTKRRPGDRTGGASFARKGHPAASNF